MGMGNTVKHWMAKRAAEEIKNGMVVNLGIGLPSLVPDHLPSNVKVIFHAENGISGMGPSPTPGKEDENLCNAGGLPVTIHQGGSYFDTTIAFGMIRKGLIDLSILGALQVSSRGDLANWIVPGKRVPGIGGAIELAAKTKKLAVMMMHSDKEGRSKLVNECSLPLTAQRCVDLVITDLGVFSIEENGLLLTDVFVPHTVEEIINHTEANIRIAPQLRWIGGEVDD
ncbi:3-oxoacid CoA-transferase subunit B [Lederbergia citrea]|uniref:3-oxoacid CoA-transferase subunit B n=1 Tax=Lederbergia citrea TaxID=2833581 RepID=UPI001BC98FA7|nr:3-oxoacid CoA-transferase subunit B [Lederbergia citrea]MBS4176650.1 3-oxoacid CoA-transferase subunit B [Lederbergia citrea]